MRRRVPSFFGCTTSIPTNPFDAPGDYARLFEDESADVAEPYDTRPYDREIRFADHEMGRLLDALDALVPPEETVVLAVSDHGEGLMQHGYMGHGLLVYEEAVRVPFVARWEGRIAPGRVLPGPVEITDVMPTALGLLDLDVARGRVFAGTWHPTCWARRRSPRTAPSCCSGATTRPSASRATEWMVSSTA